MSMCRSRGKNRARTDKVTLGLVPMLHVLDVERSVTFYKLLGFAVGNRVPKNGPMHWAWLYAPRIARNLDLVSP